MRSNPGDLLKSFLLYLKIRFTTWCGWVQKMCTGVLLDKIYVPMKMFSNFNINGKEFFLSNQKCENVRWLVRWMKYECRKGRWKLDKKCKKIGENLPIFLYDFPPLFANSIFGISFFEAFPTIELIDFSCAFSIKLVNVAYYHSVLSLTLFSQTGILFVNVIHTYFTFFTFISNTYLKWLKKVSKSISVQSPMKLSTYIGTAVIEVQCEPSMMSENVYLKIPHKAVLPHSHES